MDSWECFQVWKWSQGRLHFGGRAKSPLPGIHAPEKTKLQKNMFYVCFYIKISACQWRASGTLNSIHKSLCWMHLVRRSYGHIVFNDGWVDGWMGGGWVGVCMHAARTKEEKNERIDFIHKFIPSHPPRSAIEPGRSRAI